MLQTLRNHQELVAELLPVTVILTWNLTPTMQMLRLFKKILATSGILCCFGFTIGDITEFTGETSISRSASDLSVSSGLDILLNDVAITNNGRMAITFLDESNLRLTEHSEVVIDSVIYDPNPDKSKMVLNFAQGTARFASGKLALMNKSNIRINTPVATIGIRGTDFTTTIDELGRSLIILLPDATGASSGEITVTNDAGTVVLDEAFEATSVATISSPPVQPVKVENITVSQIDNMFIVSPPDEIEQAIDEEQSDSSDSNILDVDFLEFNELERDYFKEIGETLDDYNELDIDFLNVDFLQDLLLVLDMRDPLSLKKKTGRVNIEGTLLGYDPQTQYNTIVDRAEGTVWFYRQVTGVISLKFESDANFDIYTYTDERPSIIKLGDGGNTIIIRQQGG